MNLDAKSLAMSFGSVTAARSMGHLQRIGCPNAWADDVDDCAYVSQRYGRLQLDINMDGFLHRSGLVDSLGRRSWLANWLGLQSFRFVKRSLSRPERHQREQWGFPREKCIH